MRRSRESHARPSDPTHDRFATPVLAIALLAGLLACGEASPPAQAPKSAEAGAPGAPRPPNLVLITMDTTRADALGIYGQHRPTSPRIDRMGREGVVFDQVVTSSPETLPSHATVFTGLQPYVHGVRSNAGYRLSERNVTLAEVLSEAGYRTGAEIAADVLSDETRIAQGYESVQGVHGSRVQLKKVRIEGDDTELTRPIRVGADITNRGIAFLRAHRDEPFHLWLHYFDPHNPYSAPPQFNSRIPDSPYHAEVALADYQIGRVLDAIEELGLRERTLVVLTADHGEGLGDHGETTHAYFVWDSTMRVPLVLWGLDGLPVGERILSLVRTVDIAPTALDLLGMPPLEGVQGTSLVPLLRDPTSDLALTGYGESMEIAVTFETTPLRFIREGKWKYIHKTKPSLYDVSVDPKEEDDLADAHPEITKRLRDVLEAELRSAPPPPGDAHLDLDADRAAELAALGYVGDTASDELLSDELASLALRGRDPGELVEDVRDLAVGVGFLLRDEWELALAPLQRIHERNPQSWYIASRYGQVLSGTGRHEQAIPLLREAMARNRADAAQIKLLARSLEATGQSAEAIDVLTSVVGKEVCNEEIHSDLNRLLRETGRYAELVSLLASASERCPEEITTLNNYAWALATVPQDDLRDGAKAIQVAQFMIGKLPRSEPAYLDTLAAAHAESGDFDEARRLQTQALAELSAMNAPGELLDALRLHLEAYREGRALRDPER